MQAIRALAAGRYLALVLVGLSVPAFGIISLTFLMFCDHGPVLLCFARMAATAAVPVLQIISLVKASSLIKQQRRPLLTAALLFLSVLPLAVAAIYLSIGI